MDYTTFPTIQGSPSPDSNQTTTTSFTGGGTIPSGTVLNFGGPTGISVNGSQGIWAGASTLSAAPFSVNLQGNLVATSGTFSGSITGSTVTGSTIQTGTSGQRVVINSSTNEIDFYDTTGTLAGSINGSLLSDGAGHNLDTLLLQSSATTGSAIKLIWTDGVSGLSRVYMDGYGGVPQVLMQAQTAPSTSSAITVGAGTMTIASTGGINYLPNNLSSAPVVTGSRGGNAALASLLTALNSLGLIVDSSTP